MLCTKYNSLLETLDHHDGRRHYGNHNNDGKTEEDNEQEQPHGVQSSGDNRHTIGYGRGRIHWDGRDPIDFDILTPLGRSILPRVSSDLESHTNTNLYNDYGVMS